MSNFIVQPKFIPTTKLEMDKLGWKELDILLVTGDAYVDHPSFAAALLGRWLIHCGYRTGIVSQPSWESCSDFTVMGTPKLFVGVTSGAMDSMLAHYTAFRKKRSNDNFTPGGKCGNRPNRAVIVYTNLVKQAFPKVPVVIGGIEASLRRTAHYDFWSDNLRRPILQDAKADILVYGMGERAISDIAQSIKENRENLKDIPGTCVVIGEPETEDKDPDSYIILPSFEEIKNDKKLLMTASLLSEKQVHKRIAAYQKSGAKWIKVNPPAENLTQDLLDTLYSLPYMRLAHPKYKEPVPAVTTMLSSITTHRGCAGGCSFCSLSLHQGRRIASRSFDSIINEAKELTTNPNFNGSITDIGGPSANMWQAQCAFSNSPCKRTSCLYPKVCPGFKDKQSEYVKLLYSVKKINKIKHLRIASGIRCDLAMKNQEAVRAFVSDFTGGQLKIAPEHISQNVLDLMRKPDKSVFESFVSQFEVYSKKAGKEQYVVPYLMSAFPGCTDENMHELAKWLRLRHWQPQQVQCFIPTPGVVATAMYYAEIAQDGTHIYVARTDAARMRQHGIIAPSFGKQDARSNRNKDKDHNDHKDSKGLKNDINQRKPSSKYGKNKPSTESKRNANSKYLDRRKPKR